MKGPCMKRLASPALTVVMMLCLIVGSERRAWGYVDPGSGLIALQTLASVVAAYLYVVRRKIRAFLTRKQPKPAAVVIPQEASQTREAA